MLNLSYYGNSGLYDNCNFETIMYISLTDVKMTWVLFGTLPWGFPFKKLEGELKLVQA